MRRRLLVLVALVVVLTSGCLRAEVDLEVHGDGSGELRVLEAVEERALARLDVESPGDVVVSPADLPEGVSARPYRSGGFVGTELRTDFDDLGELGERMAQIDQVLSGLARVGDDGAPAAGPLHPTFEDFTVARTGTGWYFEAGAAIPSGAELAALAPGSAARLQVQVSVRLPGRAVAHNADRVDGGRFAWNLGPGDRRERLIAETTTVGSTSPPWGLLALGLGLVAVAGGIGWFLLDDRRRPPAPDEPGTAADAAGWPASPPTGLAIPSRWSVLSGPSPPPAPPGSDAPPSEWSTVPPPVPPSISPAAPPEPGAPEAAGPPARPPGPGSPPARPPDLPPRPG